MIIKGKTILGLVTVLVITVLLLVGCSKASTTTSATTTSATTSIPTKPSATTTIVTTSKPASGGTLGNILSLASGIASMKYDMVISGSQTLTATVWVKKTKMRMETTQQGQNVVMLINSDTKTMYMYTPAQNTAVKLDFSQAPQSATDNANSILKNNPTVVGTETLDGKVCQVIQYTSNSTTTKDWIWEAKGLPVRVQATTSQGTSTTDFKNYNFNDIPDNMFELPSGVQITTLGLPSGLPPGLPTTTTAKAPPALPASHAGRTQCLVCHANGVGGAPVPLASAHTGFTDAMCLACHK